MGGFKHTGTQQLVPCTTRNNNKGLFLVFIQCSVIHIRALVKTKIQDYHVPECLSEKKETVCHKQPQVCI